MPTLPLNPLPNDDSLQQLRRALQIPDSVLIISGEKFNAFPSKIGKQPNNYQIPQGAPKDSPIGTSVLNTPVYTTLQFLPFDYTDNRGIKVNVPGQSYNAVLITVNQAKKIISTEIQGRDGTVKEYIGMDDYVVTVTGILTGTNGVRPVDEIIALKKILDAPVEIPVACQYLQMMDIHNLVTYEYNFEEQAGGYSYQTFSITFRSDVPQQLRLTGI